ncbi:MAG: NAD(P)-dependent alcohol dehydrogenase [Deltaproteobacteria bacterium]|nr:NAD(P)-dependent alcohol dehydrogenase [Deltaproteobacteria bacterium]
MKAIEIQSSFGLDNLRLVERSRPSPGPGEILLRMKAASLNYRDLLMVKGLYNPRQALPLVPCSDGVGEVVGLGAGVTRFVKGDRVAPIFAPTWRSGRPTLSNLWETRGGPLDGTLTEYLVVSEEAAVSVPAYLSDIEAACLPCAAVTAWTTLVVEGGLKAGDWVLVQGSGGVSTFALKLCRLFGARAIAISSSDEKLARLKELGAVAGINYTETPRWGRAVRQLTGGQGVDLVVEVGGAETLAESLAAVGPGGFIGMIGVLSGTTAPLSFTSVLMKYVRIQGIFVGHRDSFEAMNRAFEANEVRPVVDSVYSLAKTRQAFEHLAAGAHFGKVCIELS